MIRNFLAINCIGKNDSIGLKVNNNFFIKKFQTKINNNDILVSIISDFLKTKDANIDKKFSILVNNGPGSFSSVRVSLAVAKGIKISTGAGLYGYNNSDLGEFSLKNIEILISKNLLENKLIKPVYLS
tara:strand:- start:19 stop:402 length:384 start_codon:yes stop_codon:yes gene_type:complete